MLLFLVAVSGTLGYAYWYTHRKAEELRLERNQLRNDDFMKEIEITELAGRLQEAKSAASKQEHSVQRLSTELGKAQQQLEAAAQSSVSMQTTQEVLASQHDELKQRWQELNAAHEALEEQHADLTKQLQECQAEREALAKRLEHLDKIDANVWIGTRTIPSGTAGIPAAQGTDGSTGHLPEPEGRRGQDHAGGQPGRRLRHRRDRQASALLAVDLDYQGTLSNMCVMRELLDDRRNQKNRRTAHLLLDDGVSAQTLEALKVPIDGTANQGQAIVADDELDHVDFRQQARFAVEQHEVRFAIARRFMRRAQDKNLTWCFSIARPG